MTRKYRYVEGLGLRPHPAGLDVVGGAATIRLKRQTERIRTLSVVELIRSGHSLEEAAVILGQPVEAVEAWVAPLSRLGVLTLAAHPNTSAPRQMVRYLERILGVEAAGTALDRLAGARVCLQGDAEVCRAIARLLQECGVPTVDSLPSGSNAGVLLVRSASIPSHGDSDATLPTLFVTPTADGVLVGPLCNVPGGRCSHCCRPFDTDSSGSPADASDAASFEVGLAIAVGEVVRWLAGTGYCRTSGGAIGIRGGGREQRFKEIVRDPACTLCGLTDELSPEAVEAYRSVQTADVPLKSNWSHPVRAVHASNADSTIKVYPMPQALFRVPERTGALGVVADVFAPRPAARSDLLSVGGNNLLNVFLYHRDGDDTHAYLLDRRRGLMRPLPAAKMPQRFPLSDGQLTVIVAATVNRAEMLFGTRAFLTVHQDTGYALGALRTALARNGFSARSHSERSLPSDVMHALGLDPGRDIVTAIIDVPLRQDFPVPRPHRRARGAGPSIGRADLEAMLAACTGDGGEAVVCWRGNDVEDGSYRWSDSRLDRVRVSGTLVDTALRERGLDPGVLVVFTTDIGRALAEHGPTGIDACVVAQARSAQELHRAARERGFDAMVFADLPSTALAPDGKGWRTGYRSFASVGLAARGALGGAVGPAVLW